jgi:predicted RNA-binding protein with PIN domain
MNMNNESNEYPNGNWTANCEHGETTGSWDNYESVDLAKEGASDYSQQVLYTNLQTIKNQLKETMKKVKKSKVPKKLLISLT